MDPQKLKNALLDLSEIAITKLDGVHDVIVDLVQRQKTRIMDFEGSDKELAAGSMERLGGIADAYFDIFEEVGLLYKYPTKSDTRRGFGVIARAVQTLQQNNLEPIKYWVKENPEVTTYLREIVANMKEHQSSPQTQASSQTSQPSGLGAWLNRFLGRGR